MTSILDYLPAEYDPTYPAYPILAGFSIICTLLPAYWHFKSGNVGTILYIIWTLLGNFIFGINSIIWAGNIRNPSWFWCDLTTKLMVGISVGLPAASLAINRRLYMIASVRTVHVSKGDSRRNTLIEVAFGVGLPVLVMILHVISQGHRFDIIENVGCWPSSYITPMLVFTNLMWPILIGLVALVYCVLAIRAFIDQRKAFAEVLQSTNSGLNVNRYFRLMALSGVEIVCSLPFSIYILCQTMLFGLHPWISWEDTHYNFNRAEYLPYSIFKLYPTALITNQINRWALPVSGFLFFGFLGLSGESGQYYKRQWRALGLRFGFVSASDVSPGVSWVARPGASAPSHMRSVPPYATTHSLTSSAGAKRASLDLYAMRVNAKANSSTDSLSLAPDLREDSPDDQLDAQETPPTRGVAEVPAHVA